MANPFYKRDVLSMKDFQRDELELLFSTADKLLEMKYREKVALGEGRILGIMFFEPSTRTRLSFESAMASIGGISVGFSETRTTSIEKGESLADTVRVVEANSDVLVLRHSNEGAARFAAEIADKPVVSGGTGTEEHPTQAMLDLYTILKEKKKIDGLRIGIVGDLKYGRTVYSLIYGLAKYDVKIDLVAPEGLKIRKEATHDLGKIPGKSKTVEMTEHENLHDLLPELDVLYVTRIQRERFPDEQEYEEIRGSYFIDAERVKSMKKDSIILHPLPRNDEIKPDVDPLSQARYFKQMQYGRIVRASLLSLILNP
ncbi:MAG TPA: aspartate carbamoyltransferase [Nitrososphaerales archaeon]|nr:aspartate carbamoyltransferase [Nitrososphaerales archaeon]